MKFNRVTIAIVVLILIQLVFLAADIASEKRQHIESAMITGSKMALVARSATEDFFGRYLAIFEALKSTDAVIQQEGDAASRILQRLNGRHPEIVNFAAVKKDGIFFASGKPIPVGNPPNIEALEFFQRIRSGDKLVIMQPHTGPISKESVTGIVVPLEDVGGHFNGLVGVSLKFQNLIQRWAKFATDSGVMMVVHDERGSIYFASSGLTDAEAKIASDEAAGVGRVIQLKQRTHALHTIIHTDSGWHLTMIVPAHLDLRYLAKTRRELIFLLGIMAITVIVLLIWHFEERRWNKTLVQEQEKLKWSETIFRQFAENIDAVFWLSPPDKSAVIYVSPAFEKVWGKACKALYDNPWLWVESILPEDREHIRTSALERQAKGTYDEHYRIVRDDGEVRWIHDRAYPLTDTDGNIYRLVGIAEDITESRQAEADLRESEARLRSLIQAIPDLVWLKDPQGVYLMCNSRFEHFFGAIEKDIIGKTDYDFVPKELADAFRRHDQAAVASQGIKQNEEEVIFADDGHREILETIKTPIFTQDGQLYGVLGIGRDITSRKEAERALKENEAKFRQVFESANVGKSITLPTGEISVNKAFADMLGYRPEELEKKSWEDITPAEEVEPIKEMLSPVIVGEKDATRFTKRYIHKNGSFVWTDVNLVMQRDTTGLPLYFVVTVVDITEQKHAQELLRISEERFSSAFHLSPAGMTITRIADGSFVDVNDAFLKMFEFNRQEVIGHTSIELGIFTLKAREKLIQGQIESGGLRNHELQAFSRSGRLVTILFSSKPMELEGEPCHITTLIDITNRKQAQESLRISEERLRLSTELANVAVWEYDFNADNMSRSRNHDSLYGLPWQETWTIDTFLQATHPKDRDFSNTIIQRAAAPDGPDQYRFDFRVVYPDKSVHWLMVVGQVKKRNVQGQAILVHGSLQDITERKLAEEALRRSEERFKRALANIPDVVVIYDTDLKITYINEATMKISGRPTIDFIGRREEELWPPEVYKKYLPAVKEAFSSGKIQRIEAEIVLPGRDPVYLAITCVPLIDETGNVNEVLGISHNLTESKTYEHELKNFTTFLQEEIENERILISREIHDDLGQTMSALKLDIGWIKRRLTPDQQVIQEKLDSMAGMIRDSVQTVKRICSDLRPGILDDMGLEPGLEWLVAGFQERHEIDCSLLTSGLDREIPSDVATAIFRITQETLTNVSRHAGATRVQVRLDNDAAGYRLEIVDDGCGWDPQAKNQKVSFGLIGMRERASALGGQFAIDSSPGEGTTIRVHLPRQKIKLHSNRDQL